MQVRGLVNSGSFCRTGEARERETTLSLVWPRVLDHLRSETAETHHFEVDLPESLPPVAGGTEEWSQMLAALVENALEAMPAGGVVTVRAAFSDRPGLARVTIQDNGPGIPPDVLPHVLEPFYTSRSDSGAEGLGLATVASLVEALEGELHLTSSLAGTTVEIEVPFYASATRPEAARPLRLPGTVLVADDDKDFRRSLVRLLESFGLEVSAVDSGTVALALVKERPDRFRAAIFDVVMPGTPVPEVVMGIRELRPAFPCLLVSGLATARLVDSLLALGGVRFLKKPFTREELYYCLRDLFTVETPGPGAAA
jgi:two-component system cell cycle sensor histidine kinase/response regulator CckA